MSAPHRTKRSRSAGFTLLELLISMTVLLTVIGAIFTIVDPSQGISKTQPEVSDMQERMRVAADMLQRDLLMAGAGTYSGAIAGGLANFFPPILPRRTGAIGSDDEMLFYDDRISIAYVPDTASQTTVADPMPQPSSEIKVTAEPGCPTSGGGADPLCGFKEGMRVVIFDDTGSFDIFTITQVQSDSLHLQHRPPNPDFSKAYTPGENSRIAQVDNHVYYIDNAGSRIHHYDGFLEDLPIVDNAVQLHFRYFGDPNPPLAPRPVAGTANCIFDAAGNPLLPTLSSNGSSLVELTKEMLEDGPICGTAPNRFDADLYRVRKVSVELRMQVGLPELRGANPSGKTLFVNPGQAGNAYRRVPDYAMAFEVAPRNMNLVR